MHNVQKGRTLFSPYSRGWSLMGTAHLFHRCILPVFAGMVHSLSFGLGSFGKFSPYSRGWSAPHRHCGCGEGILPVFAGMVPRRVRGIGGRPDSPRIRGDGPHDGRLRLPGRVFSPYSRGWSRLSTIGYENTPILPVFAGMVPGGGTRA